MLLKILHLVLCANLWIGSSTIADLAHASGGDERTVIRSLGAKGTVNGINSTGMAINSAAPGNNFESMAITAVKISNAGAYFRWDGSYVWAIVNNGTSVYQLRSHDLTDTGYGIWTGGDTDGSGAGRYFLDLLVATPGTGTTYNYKIGQPSVTDTGLRFTLTQGSNPITILSITDVIQALNSIAPSKTSIAAAGTTFGTIGATNWSASARWHTTGFTTPANGTETALNTAAAVTIFPTTASFTFTGKVPGSPTALTFSSNPVSNLDNYISGTVGTPIVFYRNNGDNITIPFDLTGFSASGGPTTQITNTIAAIKRVNHQFPIAPGNTPSSASPMSGLLSAFNRAIYNALPALLNNMLVTNSAKLPSFAGSPNYHVGMVAAPENAEEFRITTAIAAAGTTLTIVGNWYDNQQIEGRIVGNQSTLTCNLANIGAFLSNSNVTAPALSNTSTDTIFPIGPSNTSPAVFLFKDTTNGYALALYTATGISMGAQTIGNSGVVAAHATAIANKLNTDNIFAVYNGTTTDSNPNIGHIGCIKPVSMLYLATGNN